MAPPTNNDYLPLVFEPNKPVLVTCNKRNRVYPDLPGPSDNTYGIILFAMYDCDGGKWVNRDIYYSSISMRCTKGCANVAKNTLLHASSSPSECSTMNDDDDEENPPAYIKCEISCISGYYPSANAENQLSTQTVYCKYSFGQAYWEINTGTNLKPFVNCMAGCFAYGSFKHEETYGMNGNFKSIGKIDGVIRYVMGEIKCDENNGYFAKSLDLDESITLSCSDGNHWEPFKTNYYCIKGCLKPGGSFGEPAITGYYFSCGDGSNGWYLNCAFTCNGEMGYTMVGRSNRLPDGPMSETIECSNGSFDMSKTRNTCQILCQPPTKICDSGLACTGIVYSHTGADTGKRYCVSIVTGLGAVQLMREQFKSQVSALMIDIFGGYTWLL